MSQQNESTSTVDLPKGDIEAIAVDPTTGNFYLCCHHCDAFGYDNRLIKDPILILQKDGILLKTIKSGAENGKFRNPSALIVDSCLNLVVVDRGNNRIQILDLEGNFKRKFGQSALYNPYDIAIDPTNGNFVVLDKPIETKRLQLFSQAGILQGEIPVPDIQSYTIDFNGYLIITTKCVVEIRAITGELLRRFNEGFEGHRFYKLGRVQAAKNGNFVVENRGQKRLEMFAIKTCEHVMNIECQQSKGFCFDYEGKLCVLTDKQIMTYG